MYCPNCGVEINPEGSYCAKCRKNITYLTEKKILTPEDIQLEELIKNATLDESPVLTEESTNVPPQDIEEIPLNPVPSTPIEEKGYYCNHCGTFVYPKDNYCYSCGKNTRKKYYKVAQDSKKKKIICLSTAVLLGVACIFWYFFLN